MEMQETMQATEAPVPVVNGSGTLRCNEKYHSHEIPMDRAYLQSLEVLVAKRERPIREEHLPKVAICGYAAKERRDRGEEIYSYTSTLARVRETWAQVTSKMAFWCSAEGVEHIHTIPRRFAVVMPRAVASLHIGLADPKDLTPSELHLVVICNAEAQKYHKMDMITPYYDEALEDLLKEEEERNEARWEAERARQLALEAAEMERTKAEIAEGIRFARARQPKPKTPRWKNRKNQRGAEMDAGEE